MTTAAESLAEILARPEPDPKEVAYLFDELSMAGAVAAARSLSGRRLQGALWKAVEGNPRISTDDLVPADYPTMKPVVFHGKNSLPAFTEFEKICFRPANARESVLWGYNETSIKSLVGPGYYVVHDTGKERLGGTAFDYRQLPDDRLPAWPEIRPNDAGLSRFVYNNTVDYMRRVAKKVFIGSATRNGKELGSYFVLVRELH